MDYSPRSTKHQLPEDSIIKQDTMLRYDHPIEVFGAISKYLRQQFPTVTQIQFGRTQQERIQVARRWSRKSGISADIFLQKMQQSTGIAFDNEFVILAELWVMFGHPTIVRRAEGWRIMAHEWWHILRKSKNTIRFFEEGSAEYFAEWQTREALRPAEIWLVEVRIQQYKTMLQAIELMVQKFGIHWLMESRQTNDIPAWFQQSLFALGVPEIVVHNFMTAFTPDQWLECAKLIP